MVALNSRTSPGDEDDSTLPVLDGTASENNHHNNNWLFALVLPLQLVYISNQWSRSSIYYLVNFSPEAAADSFRAMNVAIGFSEAQYGLLASLAFTTLFAIASLGAGAAADRYDRKALTVVSAVGWSLATVGTSLSSSYTQVLSWRIAMGLFCAFSTPTAYTLINQKVPKDRISLATSIYGTGVAFGGALASLSILLDNELGWKQAIMIIGAVGITSAVIVGLLLPGDSLDKSSTKASEAAVLDKKNANEDERSFFQDVSEAVSSSRAKWIFLGSFFRFSSGLCIGVWSAPFFRMTFPDNAGEYAVVQAFITAIGGSVSGIIGGAAADYLSTAAGESENRTEKNLALDQNGRRLWVPVIGSLLAAPTWYLAVHSTDSFQVAMVWLAVEYLVAECWFGPTISTLLSTVPSKIGGTAQGMFTLTGGVANLAPTILGYLYGQASGIEESSGLLTLLSAAVCFGYVSSAFCFAMGAKSQPPSSTSIKLKQN
jgi:MFS family permease